MIVYADFTCPECFLAARLCAALESTGVAVDWRAVERRPAHPVTADRPAADEHDALARRLTAITDLLPPGEPAPPGVPGLDPRTGPAASAYAEAYGSPVARDVRRVLMDLYWRDAADIGDPNALRTPLVGPMLRAGATAADPIREAGWAVSVTGGPVTTEAYRRLRDWRAEWERLGRPALPVVLLDGEVFTGTAAVHRLADEVHRTGARARAARPDPRRYPEVAVTPSRSWVSQVGGRWRNAYRVAEPA